MIGPRAQANENPLQEVHQALRAQGLPVQEG